MIGGKAGIINMHIGDARDPFHPLHDIVANSRMGYKQFVPTHCNRNDYILQYTKEYGKKDIWILLPVRIPIIWMKKLSPLWL
jgi:beta-aspartyl-dipeptidase (metallo-type)